MFFTFSAAGHLLTTFGLLNFLLSASYTGFVTARTDRQARHALIARKTPTSPNAPNGLDATKYNTQLTTQCKLPKVGKTITVTKPTTVKAGQTFDCQFNKYETNDHSCNLNKERGGDAAVFLLEDGATLKNCFLGYSQESVYCLGKCTVENSHWLQICDEAIAFYQTNGSSTVKDCSFSNAGNKALQSNVKGGSTINVEHSCFYNVEIAYRSCGLGHCPDAGRNVVFDRCTILNVKTLAGFNHDKGDTVVIKGHSDAQAETLCEDKQARTSKGSTPPGCLLA